MSDDKTFVLPDLGEGLTEGEVVRWLVEPGSVVEVDQPVVEVETAKAVVEVPCPYAGAVLALHAEPGNEVAVGQPLLTVGAETGETAAASADDAGGAGADTGSDAGAGSDDDGSGTVLVGYGTGGPRARRRGHPATANGDGAPTAATGVADATGRPLAKPPVRKLAKDLGLDLADVPPTGAGGVITREDVEAYAASTQSSAAAAATPGASAPPIPHPGGPEPVERRPLRGLRRTIADRMARAHAEIPAASASVDCDATELMALRDDMARRHDVRLSPLALIMRAVVAGLRRVPELNSRLDLDADEIVVQRFVNLGFAAQTDAGLMVPVIHGAEAMSTLELGTQLTRLTAAARDRTITPAELAGSTFTVSNYGTFGVDSGDMVINHPEAAILGVGRIADRPWVVDGAVVARSVVNLAVTFDHRVCDGGEAGAFLRFVADCVESPTRLLAEL